MMSLMRPQGFVLCLLAVLSFASVVAAEKIKKPVNFVQAEGRVADLISKLDAVSNHAARANDEIQTTLRELWQIVDLLGRDRCGDVVEKVRTLQRKATARVEKLEGELASRLDVEQQLRRDVHSRTVERDSAREKIEGTQREIDNAKEEITKLKEDVRKAKRTCVLDGSYKVVAERLTEVRSISRSRMDVLEKILRLTEEEKNTESNQLTKLEGALEGLRAAGREGGETSGEARLRKELSIVTSQLRAVKMERDDMSNDISNLQREVERVKASKGSPETVVFQDASEGSSWTGVIALICISLGSGLFFTYLMFGANAASRGPAPPTQPASGASPAEKYGSYTPNQRTPEGFAQQRASPVSYLGNSGKSTPHGSSTTPRLY